MGQRGNILMRIADRWAGIPIVVLMGLCRHRKLCPPSRVKQIGLIALGAVGDLLLSVGASIPALRKKYPDAQIHVFTTPSNHALIPVLPIADSVTAIHLSRPDKAMRLIRKTQFDLLIDYSPWPRIGAILTAGAKASFTVGFVTARQYRHFAYDKVVFHRSDVHELNNNAALMQAVGVSDLSPPDICSSVSTADFPAGAERYGRYVVFHPWAAGFRKEMRQWPAKHWQALALKVAEAGYAIFVTGGPGDRAECVSLLKSFALPEEKMFNACGVSLKETAAIIKHCKVMVSINSGPMHLAAALHVPLVALNGPTNPVRWGPLSDMAVNISPAAGEYAYLDLGFEYPKHVKPCMQNISVECVWHKVDKFLS